MLKNAISIQWRKDELLRSDRSVTDIHDEKVAFGLYIRSPSKIHPRLIRD